MDLRRPGNFQNSRMRRKAGGVSRKNAHTAGYQRYTYRHSAPRPDQPHGGVGSMAAGRNRAASSAGSAPSQQTKAAKNKKLKQDRTNRKRREARRRAKDRAWYILVRGIAPGLYSSWEEVERQIAASVAAGHRDPRAYRYKSRMQALEGFLHWWNGKRVYASHSTMRSRNWHFLPAKFLEFKGVAQAYAVTSHG